MRVVGVALASAKSWYVSVAGVEGGVVELATVQVQVGCAVSVPIPPAHEKELNVAVASELYSAVDVNVFEPPALVATKTIWYW
jgi:hypothetical protein